MNALNPEEASQELERIKHEMYHFCKEDVDEIISNGVRDTKRIQRLLDYLFVFNPDETFMDLFWKMIGYAETFDTGIGAFYRRLEELVNTGF